MSEPLCKICGLTRPQDVELCHSLRVDIVGFIFARKSPRAVSAEAAAAMPRGPALRAGIFAGLDAGGVMQTARQARLDLIQLHGGEDETFCRAVGPERVIKVFWPESLSAEELAVELERFAPVAAYFLLDAGLSGGGSGESLRLEGLLRLTPPRPWFLSGGLGPRNLGQTIAAFDAFARAPAGVDLNSALETSPGVKNHALIRASLAILNNQSGRRPSGVVEHL